MHPVVAGVLLIAVGCIFFLPRKYVVVAVLLSVLLIPTGQVVVIGGVHVDPAKVIVIPGLIRAGFDIGKWNPLDSAFLAWAICRALAFILLWMQPAALANKAGFLWEALGMYLLLRALIQNDEDVIRVIRVLSVIAAINAIEMIHEQTSNQNLFGMFGGIHSIPEFRAGKIRSSGAFQISILAGTFGVTCTPLFIAAWKYGKARSATIMGIASAAVMALTCASSTPLSGFAAVILGFSLWPVRKHIPNILRGFALLLVVLHLIMKAPVWFLIAHIDLTGASSGYHRAMIVDQCIAHFTDWCLFGTKDTSQWGVDMWDKCDQYVLEAEEGGLFTLCCFIALLVVSFKRLKKARNSIKNNRPRQIFLWGISVAIFTHIVCFLGADYFDQSEAAWFTLLAIVSAVTATDKKAALSISVEGANERQDEVIPSPIMVREAIHFT